jgi:hypothetical protein
LAEVHAKLLPADVLGVLVILEFFKGQGCNFGKALDRLNSGLHGHDELSE